MFYGHGIQYKYVRIQGNEIVENTGMGKGMFSLLEALEDNDIMDDEDKGLFDAINDWCVEILPFPPQCQEGARVVCYFKMDNSEEMLKLVNPMLWLLERYKQPYNVIYTNYPGEIVYEDQFQIVVKVPEPVVVKVVKRVTGIKKEEGK